MKVLLLAASIVCFLLAALTISVGSLALVPLGLALFAAAHVPG